MAYGIRLAEELEKLKRRLKRGRCFTRAPADCARKRQQAIRFGIGSPFQLNHHYRCRYRKPDGEQCHLMATRLNRELGPLHGLPWDLACRCHFHATRNAPSRQFRRLKSRAGLRIGWETAGRRGDALAQRAINAEIEAGSRLVLPEWGQDVIRYWTPHILNVAGSDSLAVDYLLARLRYLIDLRADGVIGPQELVAMMQENLDLPIATPEARRGQKKAPSPPAPARDHCRSD